MHDSKLDVPESVAYRVGDVITVAVAGIGVMAFLAYLVQKVSGMPGVVVPLAILWIGAGIIHMTGANGVVAVAKLTTVPKEYKKWLLSAVVFGMLMPAVFPDGAYESSPWLMWFNATVLVCGCLGGWAARFFGVCIHQLVVSKAESGKRS